MKYRDIKSILCMKILLLSSVLILSSCVSESGRKGRGFVKDFTKLGAESVGCGDDFFIIDAGDSCIASCEEDQHIATAQEINDYIANLTEPQADLNDIISGSKGVCIANITVVKRPSEVYVQRDFCACVDGQTILANNCQNFCRGKTEATPFLYINVKVGPSIELNEKLKNLTGWCINPIEDGLTSPSCTLQANDGSSTVSLPFSPPANSNSFKVDISLLQKDKTYVVKIVESNSGSNAESDSFHIRKIDPPSTEVVNNSPLKLMPVSMYTCVQRTGPSDNNNVNFFVNAARLHFYFPSNGAPDSLPPGNQYVTCHDPQYGINDSPLYPRMELIPQHFSVWDQGDSRFADLNQNGRPDINETIQTRLLTEYGINRTINIFGLLSWRTGPPQANSNGLPNIGFYMVPWIDQLSGHGFCPGQDEYNGNDKTFNILKEVVRIDTEGIFIAKKEPVALEDESGNLIAAPDDFIFVRENLLKKIWFYTENNQILIPDENTVNQKTIHFYWPADTVNPHIRKSTQKVYTVREPSSVGGGTSSGLQTYINPPDKRLGCIPAID